MTEDQLRELFSGMREEPVPVDSLVRMRTKLAARTAPRDWKRPIGLVLLFATACVWLVSMLLRPAAPLPVLPAPSVARTPQVPFVIPAIQPLRQTRPRHRLRQAASHVPPALPISIRIETPDPDVVILLVGN